MSKSDYQKQMDQIRRESITEKRVRAMDADDIVKEIHALEDENAKLRNVAETAKGFAYEDRTLEKPEWWWLEELRRALTEAGYNA